LDKEGPIAQPPDEHDKISNPEDDVKVLPLALHFALSQVSKLSQFTLSYSVAGKGSLLEPYRVDLPPRKITQAKYTLFYQAINEKIALPNRPHFSAKIADFGLKSCIRREKLKKSTSGRTSCF
jgi:hypothetical protein